MSESLHRSKFESKLQSFIKQLTDENEYQFRQRILKYSVLLQQEYGGDIDVICALVLLYKIGVKYFEFEINITIRDFEQIKKVLLDIDFPQNKLSTVIISLKRLVMENQSRTSIEEKIVNDATILATFSLRGLLRFFLWIEYSQSGVNSFPPIEIYFKERMNQLFYPESIRVAEKESKFIYLLSALLKREPRLEKSYPGKYIIIEGNSGTGKTKQAEMLENYYKSNGMKVIIVEEPTTYYKDFETFIVNKTSVELGDSKPLFRLYSIIGDRYQQVHNKVINELKKGSIVISVRSYISMLVYQCESEFDRLFINYIHSFLPKPEVVILYDAPEEICLQRTIDRGTRFTPYDKLANLKKYRPIFLEIPNAYYLDFPIEIIDSSDSIEVVTEKTIKVIEKYL